MSVQIYNSTPDMVSGLVILRYLGCTAPAPLSVEFFLMFILCCVFENPIFWPVFIFISISIAIGSEEKVTFWCFEFFFLMSCLSIF